MKNTPVTNLSMSEIKDIKTKTTNPIVVTHNYMTSAYEDHRLKDTTRVIAILLRDKTRNLFCHFSGMTNYICFVCFIFMILSRFYAEINVLYRC